MSSAWCFGLGAAHALQVGSFFEERTQAEVFGDGREFRAASVAAPDVIARRTEDGWLLDGKVGYCSGIPYSTHFVGQAIVEGASPADPDAMLMYIGPRDSWTMLDDWGDQLGLRGSGSHSIVLTGVRVPAHHVLEGTNMLDVDVSGGTPGLRLHGNPLYTGRTLTPFSLTLAAIMVGAGYNALDEYERLARTRKTSLPPLVPRSVDPATTSAGSAPRTSSSRRRRPLCRAARTCTWSCASAPPPATAHTVSRTTTTSPPSPARSSSRCGRRPNATSSAARAPG